MCRLLSSSSLFIPIARPAPEDQHHPCQGSWMVNKCKLYTYMEFREMLRVLDSILASIQGSDSIGDVPTEMVSIDYLYTSMVSINHPNWMVLRFHDHLTF